MRCEAVEFDLEGRGPQRTGSSLEALHVLFLWWDNIKGPAYRNAIETCLASFRGERSQAEARLGFVVPLSERTVKPM